MRDEFASMSTVLLRNVPETMKEEELKTLLTN